jgi:nitrogen fixation NifU-like protein
MSKDLDDFVQELQTQILEETRAAYGDTAFERWLNPLYMGSLEDPDGYASVTGSCGDTMEIFLRFENDRVVEAKFRTDGCGTTSVCGSFASEMALGKGPDELLNVTGETILQKLGGLPEEDEHCAFLAGETLQEALNAYMLKQTKKEKGKEPENRQDVKNDDY